jgi:phosphatidylglycerol---prolipoprotein diacylglyceryl transferase
MLPYIHVDPIHFGPLTFHAFGFLVATGVLVGVNLATRRARRLGYDAELLQSFITWMLAGGFFFAHALDVVFYHPDELVRRPWSIFMVWESLSSFGGFTGAVVGGVLWTRYSWEKGAGPGGISWFQRRPAPISLIPFADVIIAVFPVSWIFGRTGCAVVHDHPGALAKPTDWLAVAYPAFPGEGPRTHYGFFDIVHGSMPRYDLGLLEMLYTVALTGVLLVLWPRKLPVGFFLSLVTIAYSPVRFAMDFLRIDEGSGADPRYFHLTFAQWSAFALLGFGLYMAARVRTHAFDGLPAQIMAPEGQSDDAGDDDEPASSSRSRDDAADDGDDESSDESGEKESDAGDEAAASDSAEEPARKSTRKRRAGKAKKATRGGLGCSDEGGGWAGA